MPSAGLGALHGALSALHDSTPTLETRNQRPPELKRLAHSESARAAHPGLSDFKALTVPKLVHCLQEGKKLPEPKSEMKPWRAYTLMDPGTTLAPVETFGGSRPRVSVSSPHLHTEWAVFCDLWAWLGLSEAHYLPDL